jgi:D-alanyl-lipoteichoic acid acyltransferase DltB (MBOAT superfamily)
LLFTDPIFLFVLLPLACVVFYAITPRLGTAAGIGWLLLVSLLFYGTWGTRPLLVLLAAIAVNFAAAYFLLTISDEKPYRRYVLWSGLAYDFAVLIWFKYRLAAMSGGVPLPFAALSPAIPVGISFYTFQQAVLLIDAYNRDASVVAFFGRLGSLREKARGFLNHAFFVSFFAHVLIGPIVYLEEFQPQIAAKTFGRLRRRDLEVGLTLIVIGLFKKFIMADRLARIADPVFDAAAGHVVHGNLTTAAALAGTAAFYMQLYFDFSGYTDIALGLARLFGIRFPMNFYSPLKAAGIMDYYRRWHMTLTRAIARFFYTPLALAGTRFALRRKLTGLPARMLGQWLPLLINFQAIALWHGARLTFVLFGVFHGVWYICETEMGRLPAYRRWRERSSARVRIIAGRAVVTLLMPLSLAMFRSSSVHAFIHLVERMVWPYGVWHGGVSRGDAAMIVAAIAVIALLPNSMELLRRYRPGIATYDNASYVTKALAFAWRPSWLWALGIGGVALFTAYYASAAAPFVYLGF